MNICPHCDSPLENQVSRCPSCGKSYWQADQPPPQGESGAGEEEETEGCLPILFWPLVLSLLVSVSLISIGFIMQILSLLSDTRLKTLWILCSLAAGGALFLILSRLRRRRM
jgi:hypothetical protein